MDKNFEHNAIEIEKACDVIVNEICSDLDAYVKKYHDIVSDTSVELTNAEMDSIILNLPDMIYWVKRKRQVLGIRLDLAVKVREEKWNESFLVAEGNVTSKKVQANSDTAREAFDCIVYDRAYRMIEDSENMAFELLQSVKKVITRKMGGIQG